MWRINIRKGVKGLVPYGIERLQGRIHASLHSPREREITDKSGGQKWEVSAVERTLA
jgi:hypothetical protein